MGFPANLARLGMSKTEADSLIGESMNLSVIGTVLYCIYIDRASPWWAPLKVVESIPQLVAKAEDAVAVARKRRRISGMGS
jgi:hypothetical protein